MAPCHAGSKLLGHLARCPFLEKRENIISQDSVAKILACPVVGRK